MTLSTSSCGMVELHTLSVPTKNLLEEVNRTRYALVVFSDSEGRGNGNRLYADIVDHELGRVVRTDAKRNPNTGNDIRAFAWSPDYAALKAYLTPRKPARVAGKTRRTRR